jgi:putative FmdB family regulatory protein
MPIFEYKCQDCETTFEQLVKSSKSPVNCPECGENNNARQLSVFAASIAAPGKPNCSVSDCSTCCPSGTCGLS